MWGKKGFIAIVFFVNGFYGWSCGVETRIFSGFRKLWMFGIVVSSTFLDAEYGGY